MMFVILCGLAGVAIGAVLAYCLGLWMGKRAGRQAVEDAARRYRRP